MPPKSLLVFASLLLVACQSASDPISPPSDVRTQTTVVKRALDPEKDAGKIAELKARIAAGDPNVSVNETRRTVSKDEASARFKELQDRLVREMPVEDRQRRQKFLEEHPDISSLHRQSVLMGGFPPGVTIDDATLLAGHPLTPDNQPDGSKPEWGVTVFSTKDAAGTTYLYFRDEKLFRSVRTTRL
jgi:hypothetical protein